MNNDTARGRLENNRDGSITLADIQIPAGTVGTVRYSGVPNRFSFGLKSTGPDASRGRAGLDPGQGSGAGAQQMEFKVPKPVDLVGGDSEVNLDVTFLDSAQSGLSPQIGVDQVSFVHVDVVDASASVVRRLSTIHSGTLFMESLNGEKRGSAIGRVARIRASQGRHSRAALEQGPDLARLSRQRGEYLGRFRRQPQEPDADVARMDACAAQPGFAMGRNVVHVWPDRRSDALDEGVGLILLKRVCAVMSEKGVPMNRYWSNLLRTTIVVAVVCVGSSPAFGQTEGDLKRAFEGKAVAPRLDMPGSSDGVKITLKNPQPRDFKTEQRDIDRYAKAIPAGTSTMVTEVKARGDTIELMLGRGGVGRTKVCPRPSPKLPSDRERDLDFKNDKTAAEQAELSRLAKERTAEEAKENALVSAARQQCEEEGLKQRAAGGSRFTIQYRAKLTPADLTPENFRKVMDEYIDFAPSTAGATVKSAPVSGPGKQAEESAKQQVVMIKGTIDGDDTVGAGLIVGSAQDRLYIVTANHVVRKGRAESKDLQVMLNWLNGSWFKADLLSTLDAKSDLAVIALSDLRKVQFDASAFTFGRLGAALQRAERVRFVGYGNTQPWHESVDPAPVSLVSSESIKFQSAFLVPGDSGGVLFNEQWQVVGMNQSDQQGEAQALPFGKIEEKLKEWRHPVNLK